MWPNRQPDPAMMFFALSVPGESPNFLANSPQAIQAEMQRQQLLTDCLLGNASPEDYLDSLNDQGFSVDQYLEEVDISFRDFI